MSLAESVFGADSRFTVEALRLSRTGVLALDLTTLGVLSIDQLLGSLGASPAERLAWYRARIPARNASGQDYRHLQPGIGHWCPARNRRPALLEVSRRSRRPLSCLS